MSKCIRFAVLSIYLGCICSVVPALAQSLPTTKSVAETKPKDEEPKNAADTPGQAAKDDKEGDAKEEEKQVYIRVQRDDRKRPIAMETAIVSYVAAGDKNKGVQIDLVGAVHVGDAAYYEKLNKAFEEYDVLLYELVAPPGTQIPKGGRKTSSGLINSLQGGMKSVLELEHQLEKVDYTKKNFVHADMSPTEFAKSMRDRGESFLDMFFKAMSKSAAAQKAGKPQITETQLFMALFAKDRALRLKRLMANQFADMDTAMNLFNGPDGSTILTERNKKCMTVLEKEIDNGHKKIGIFYGAAHLSDMDKRLIDEFSMQREKTRWVVAWDLATKQPVAKKAEEKPEAGIEDDAKEDDAKEDDGKEDDGKEDDGKEDDGHSPEPGDKPAASKAEVG
jgi:hypothetical protein